jgi:hypothetical protein
VAATADINPAFPLEPANDRAGIGFGRGHGISQIDAHYNAHDCSNVKAQHRATTGGVPRVQGEPRNAPILQSPVRVTRRGRAMQRGRDRKTRVTGGSPCLC